MADGKVIVTPRILITLRTRVGPFEADEDYYVIDQDERWDLILGMRWLEKHQPLINWTSKTMHKAPSTALDSPLGVMSNELTSDPTRVSQFTTRDVATDSACVPRPTGPVRTAVDMLSRPADFDNDGIGDAMSSEIDDDAWDVCHVIQSGAPATLDSATDTMALSALHDADSYYVDEETRRNTIFN
ncbi:hypothetical protein AC1031_000046, partial [Aphanomyces cochlioides]